MLVAPAARVSVSVSVSVSVCVSLDFIYKSLHLQVTDILLEQAELLVTHCHASTPQGFFDHTYKLLDARRACVYEGGRHVEERGG